MYFSERPYWFTWEFTWFGDDGMNGVLPIEADTLPEAMQVFYEIRERVIEAGGRIEFTDVRQVTNAIAN